MPSFDNKKQVRLFTYFLKIWNQTSHLGLMRFWIPEKNQCPKLSKFNNFTKNSHFKFLKKFRQLIPKLQLFVFLHLMSCKLTLEASIKNWYNSKLRWKTKKGFLNVVVVKKFTTSWNSSKIPKISLFFSSFSSHDNNHATHLVRSRKRALGKLWLNEI